MKSLYKKYLREKKKENKNEIKDTNREKSVSFFIDVVGRIFSFIGYLILIALCSIGATYLINQIFQIKIF